MSIKSALIEAVKTSMKSGEKDRLLVLRGFSAAIKQREIDERVELSDTEQLAVLDKQIKQRKDSEAQFRKANRDDLAQKESDEIKILSEFLPRQLSEAEISAIVDAALTTVGESSISAMGKVMGIVKPQVQGKADMGQVSQLIKSKL